MIEWRSLEVASTEWHESEQRYQLRRHRHNFDTEKTGGTETLKWRRNNISHFHKQSAQKQRIKRSEKKIACVTAWLVFLYNIHHNNITIWYILCPQRLKKDNVFNIMYKSLIWLSDFTVILTPIIFTFLNLTIPVITISIILCSYNVMISKLKVNGMQINWRFYSITTKEITMNTGLLLVCAKCIIYSSKCILPMLSCQTQLWMWMLLIPDNSTSSFSIPVLSPDFNFLAPVP